MAAHSAAASKSKASAGAGAGAGGPRKSVWVEGIAGGVAGAVEATIMYPTDYLKTQLQLQRVAAKSARDHISVGASNSAMANLPGATQALPAKQPVGGMWSIARQTWMERGPLGFYRGLSTLVVGSAPKAAIRFAAFEYFSQALEAPRFRDVNKTLRTGAAGACAGAAEALLAVTPMETIKTKLVSDQNSANPRYKGLRQGVGLMLREEGVRGVYRGAVATTLKQSGNQTVRFVVFHRLKDHRIQHTRGPLSAAETFVIGATAGAASAYVTMPFDVVKTRMQGVDASRYGGSTWQAARHVYREYGVLGFWRGTVPRLARVIFSTSIIFTVQDAATKGLRSLDKPHPPLPHK